MNYNGVLVLGRYVSFVCVFVSDCFWVVEREVLYVKLFLYVGD